MLEENNDKTIVEEGEASLEDNSEQDYENTGESEAPAEAEGENTEASGSETEDDGGAKKRAQSQIDRLKAKIKELEEGGKESGQKGQQGSQQGNQKGQEVDEKYVRLDLKTEGITSKQEQDVVLDYIREKKLLGHDIEVEDALKSMVVKEELATMRKKASVPSPSSRTSTQGREPTLEQYAALLKKGKTSEVPLDIRREIQKKGLISWN